MKVSVSMKMPNISEPFCYCCIGSGEYQQVESNASTSYPTSLAKRFHQSNPVRFSEFGHNSASSPVCSIPPGLQRDYWGCAASICGNISGVCILSYIQSNHVKTLHQQGKNYLIPKLSIFSLIFKDLCWIRFLKMLN